MLSGFANVFKNKNFLKIWIAQIFSQTANNLLNFLLVVKVYDITGSNLKVSILILCFTVPSVLFSIYAGVLADRFSQKKIMYTVNFLRAVLALGFIFVGFNLWFVYILTFMISSAMQFFLPSEAARIPAIVHQNDYLAANSLYISTNYGAMIFGFSLVSAIQYVHGYNQFVIISIGFLLSAIILFFLPYDKPKIKHVTKELLFDGLKKDFLSGWHLIKNTAGVYMPIIYLVFIWIAFGVAYVLVPPLTNEILHIPTADAGRMVVLPAVIGTAGGVLVVDYLSKKTAKKHIISFGIFLVGFSAMVISLIPEVREVIFKNSPDTYDYIHTFFKTGIIAVLLAMVGFGAMAIIAPSQTILQENTEKGMMGRVFGFLNMITNVVNMLPVLIIGYIADRFHIKAVLFSISSFVVIFGIANVIYHSGGRKRF
ncbi:MAG TPA: MFS transporter [Patescibacteria group bacterium]|nr:MFS transporter [Patescibacteria group bacterium]